MNFISNTHNLEEQYAHNNDIDFRIHARRSKFVANWAAEKLGLTDEEKENYVREIILLNFEPHPEEVLKNRILNDFAHKNIELNLSSLLDVLGKNLALAQEQIAPQKDFSTAVR